MFQNQVGIQPVSEQHFRHGHLSAQTTGKPILLIGTFFTVNNIIIIVTLISTSCQKVGQISVLVPVPKPAGSWRVIFVMVIVWNQLNKKI
jgi:hypothetical protein